MKYFYQSGIGGGVGEVNVNVTNEWGENLRFLICTYKVF